MVSPIEHICSVSSFRSYFRVVILLDNYLTRIAESVQARLLKFPNLSSMLAVYAPDNHP